MTALPLLPAFAGTPRENAVYHCDALVLMRAMPDKSVDAIVSDPPYELTELDFDQHVIDWSAWWAEARRILSRPSAPVVLFSQQPFTTDLICSNRAWFRYEIIYEKTMPTGYLNANRAPLRSHENILIFSEAGASYYPVFETTTDLKHHTLQRVQADHYGEHNRTSYRDTGRRYPRSVWRFAQRDTAFQNTESLHPTAKSLLLMERLIDTFTIVGDLVVDTFTGSGSTGFAAIKHGRRFIGADNGRDTRTGRLWAEIANERMGKPYTMPMFAEAAVTP